MMLSKLRGKATHFGYVEPHVNNTIKKREEEEEEEEEASPSRFDEIAFNDNLSLAISHQPSSSCRI